MIKNPYLEEFNAIKKSEQWIGEFRARERLVLKYSWAVPTEESIKQLVECSPLVEMGAGSGYWASLIAQLGGDIVCYDNTKWDSNHFEVNISEPEVLKNHSDRTLFLCWPPHDLPMSYDSIRTFTESGGKMLAYVGESRYGCTGTDEFFRYLEQHYQQVVYCLIPNWIGLNDSLTTWIRKH